MLVLERFNAIAEFSYCYFSRLLFLVASRVSLDLHTLYVVSTHLFVVNFASIAIQIMNIAQNLNIILADYTITQESYKRKYNRVD